MEEYFDIVDENNILIGEKKLRSDVHKNGDWHRTVHIYLFRQKDDELEILVHLRAKHKDLNPNKWDTRFGGHIKAGQSIEQAVRKELKEEIGLELSLSSLFKGEVYKRDKFPNREFTNVYYFNFNGDISLLKFNDGEVQEIKWMKVDNILKSLSENFENWAGKIDGFQKVINFLKNKICVDIFYNV